MLIKSDNMVLPSGEEYTSWEQPLNFSKTYYVDCKNALADDNGPGTKEQPFKTIGRAAEVLRAGERVVISGGVYRECIRPARGGDGPDRLISYEAAEGESVVIKGSALLHGEWQPSEGWTYPWGVDKEKFDEIKVWQIKLEPSLFREVNPFATSNSPDDAFWLKNNKVEIMMDIFKRAGMVFVDGKPLKQLDNFRDFGQGTIAFWAEKNGLTLHVSFPKEDRPENHEIEITVSDQVFAPAVYGLGYIRIKGLTFEHAGNSFPVPQRGMVSANRGHHWIIEDNTVRWANSIGIDLGMQSWNSSRPEINGYHIIRNNTVSHCGICGIAGFYAINFLVEGNTIENCCKHDIEFMGESSAVKFHNAENLIFRNNVVRHISRGCGIWLDYTNVNCRVTGNVFADIRSGNGAVLIEASHKENMVDSNIIWDVQTLPAAIGGVGIFSSGSDRILAVNNLLAKCEGTGFFANAIVGRIVEGRPGTAVENKLYGNIIYMPGRSAIEFANEKNESDRNLYCKVPQGFLRIGTSDHPYSLENMDVAKEKHDLDSWREAHGQDKDSAVIEADMEFDCEALILKIYTPEKVTEMTCGSGDFVRELYDFLI